MVRYDALIYHPSPCQDALIEKLILLDENLQTSIHRDHLTLMTRANEKPEVYYIQQ